MGGIREASGQPGSDTVASLPALPQASALPRTNVLGSSGALAELLRVSSPHERNLGALFCFLLVSFAPRPALLGASRTGLRPPGTWLGKRSAVESGRPTERRARLGLRAPAARLTPAAPLHGPGSTGSRSDTNPASRSSLVSGLRPTAERVCRRPGRTV
jgi:hypothetical protein